jgi:hypothetical protein
MDERQTLAILAWAVGSVVGIMFILNGLALSFVASAPAPVTQKVIARNASAPHAPVAMLRGG